MNSTTLAAAKKPIPTAALLGIAGVMIFLCPAATGQRVKHKPEEDRSAALIDAAVSGNIDVVRDLIEKGADVNGLDARGNFPLYASVVGDHADVVELLLKKGASANQTKAANVLPVAERNNAALHAACVVGNQKVVELLIDAGADVNAFADVNQETSRMLRSLTISDPKTQQLLAKIPTELGVTPLTQASKYGHADIVRLLLERGADVNFQKPGNDTALIEAASAGRRDVIELLLGAKADVKRLGLGGRTALAAALIEEQYDSAKVLLAAGADLSLAASIPVLFQNFARGIYLILLGDNLTTDGRGPEAERKFTEALNALTAARVELKGEADRLTNQADSFSKEADSFSKEADKTERLAKWIPVLEIATAAAGGALTDYSRGQAQRQIAQVTALRTSKTSDQYFANYERLMRGGQSALPSMSSASTGSIAGGSVAQSIRGSAQSMRDSVQSMRGSVQSIRDAAQLYSTRAATCDYLIQRVTKILNK